MNKIRSWPDFARFGDIERDAERASYALRWLGGESQLDIALSVGQRTSTGISRQIRKFVSVWVPEASQSWGRTALVNPNTGEPIYSGDELRPLVEKAISRRNTFTEIAGALFQ